MTKKVGVSAIITTTLLLLAACQPQSNGDGSGLLTPEVVEESTLLPQGSPAVSASPVPTLALEPILPTSPVSETPAPGSSLVATQHGLTVTLTNLEVLPTETILDFVAQVDPAWGFTFGRYEIPPQQVYSSQLPALVDETGRTYQVRQYQGSAQKHIDADTGIAYAGGQFKFEPLSGAHLEIAIPLTLQTIRAIEPIRFTVTAPSQAHSLPLDQQLSFGELSTPVKSAQWKTPGSLVLTIDGGLQQENLMVTCLYLYQDPQMVPSGYTGCSYRESVPADRTGVIRFDPLPNFSEPVEVRAAVDVVFLEPFRFTWVRSQP